MSRRSSGKARRMLQTISLCCPCYIASWIRHGRSGRVELASRAGLHIIKQGPQAMKREAIEALGRELFPLVLANRWPPYCTMNGSCLAFAPPSGPTPGNWHLATPLERLRGKHLILFYNPDQQGGPGQGIAQEPVSPAKRGFQVDATGLGPLPQRETLTELVGIVSPLVLVVQSSQGVV